MPGYEVTAKLEKMGWHSSDTGELAFTDVEVPEENLLGPENGGFYLIMANFQWERLLMALGAVGGMQRLLETAIAYALERDAFGRPIAKFQAIRHKIAEMAVKAESARALTYHALREFVGPEDERSDAIARGELGHPSIIAGLREVTMAKLHSRRGPASRSPTSACRSSVATATCASTGSSARFATPGSGRSAAAPTRS